MKGKKIFAKILIVVMLMLTFTGCGGKTASNDGAAKPAEPTYNLKLSNMSAPADPLNKSALRFADAVKKATDGDVVIEVYNSSQLGDSISVYGELMMGTIDFAWQTVPDTYDKRVNLGMLPYLTNNWDDVRNLYTNKDLWFIKTLQEANAGQGVTLLGTIPNGYMVIAAQKLGDLNTLFDFTKKHDALIRSASIDTLIAQVETFGFRVTTIPWADLYSAMQTGVADGFYGGSEKTINMGFKDVTKYVVEYNAVNEPIGMLVSAKTMESLPAEYQDLIIKLAEEENALVIDDIEAANQEAIKALTDYGIIIITPTDEQLKEMAKVLRAKVYPMFQDVLGDELMAEVNAWVAKLDY